MTLGVFDVCADYVQESWVNVDRLPLHIRCWDISRGKPPSHTPSLPPLHDSYARDHRVVIGLSQHTLPRCSNALPESDIFLLDATGQVYGLSKWSTS